MSASRSQTLRALLVGGPMYDTLYERLPLFEQETGFQVEIVARLPHPELNAAVNQLFGAGTADVDVLSTHTKYAPSQAQWLGPLEDVLEPDTVSDLLPRAVELSRCSGRLLQLPRNIDVRLLHYRRDLFDDPAEQAAFERRHGRPLRVPETWTDLADVSAFFTRPGLCGFLFPGRDSGLFGTFYELLVGAGGELFDLDLRPAFDSPEGVWAVRFLRDLHHDRQVTPRELPGWHYDEISTAFREGRAAMVCDWPGSYHLYTNAATCSVWDRVAVAALPAGPSGIRAGYAGCHSFAIPARARNAEAAAALLRFLLSFESQLGEARRGAIPTRASAMTRVREEAAPGSADAARWALLAEAEHTMIIPPRFAAYPRCEEAIWRSIQQAMLGRLTPEDGIRQAAAEILAVLDAHAVTRS